MQLNKEIYRLRDYRPAKVSFLKRLIKIHSRESSLKDNSSGKQYTLHKIRAYQVRYIPGISYHNCSTVDNAVRFFAPTFLRG